MLLRKDEEGVIAISQPAHAWVSGQLARNWDLNDFVGVREEVCLAAEQHDIGFLTWEQSPSFNPFTGLPHTFLEMPRAIHLAIWTAGIQSVLRFGRYPALLVSKHFTALAQQHGQTGNTEERQLAEFLEEQEILQTTLETSLANDFYYTEFSLPEIVRHHQQLVSLWDWMSLLLCHGLAEPQSIRWNRRKGELIHLRLTPEAGGLNINVVPWPFMKPEVTLVCEGRHLLKSYEGEPQMREGLRGAAPIVLRIVLQAGPG